MRSLSSHVKRWFTAIVAVPLLFAIILFGSETLFAAVILAVVLIAVDEYNRMVFAKAGAWEKWAGMLIALMICLAAYANRIDLILGILTLSLLTVFFTYLLLIRDSVFDIAPVVNVVFGFMYIPLMMAHFILLRQSSYGVLWIFFVLVLAFSGDVAAYYVGRSVGKRKLLPLVSPGKTVEGTIGLMAGSILGCIVFQQFFFPAMAVGHAVILGLVGSILGQLGDLCESAIKRASGVKDSGVILPGHGGIMDRLDCLLFIVPFVYYYQMFVIR